MTYTHIPRHLTPDCQIPVPKLYSIREETGLTQEQLKEKKIKSWLIVICIEN
jgi:hypothetical protein